MNDECTLLRQRIAFAEAWLDRARQQLDDGHLERGVLALALAEAEMSRAREDRLGAASVPEARGAHPVAVAILAAAVAAVTALGVLPSILWRVGAIADPTATTPLPAFALPATSGAMLRLVDGGPTPAVAERVVTATVIRFRPVAVERQDAQRPLPAVGKAAPVSQAVPPPAALPAARIVAPPPTSQPGPEPATAVVSEADLIEMVLAAERSLRRSANQ